MTAIEKLLADKTVSIKFYVDPYLIPLSQVPENILNQYTLIVPSEHMTHNGIRSMSTYEVIKSNGSNLENIIVIYDKSDPYSSEVINILQQTHIDPTTGKIRDEIWVSYPSDLDSLLVRFSDQLSQTRIYKQDRPAPIPILKHNNFPLLFYTNNQLEQFINFMHDILSKERNFSAIFWLGNNADKDHVKNYWTDKSITIYTTDKIVKKNSRKILLVTSDDKLNLASALSDNYTFDYLFDTMQDVVLKQAPLGRIYRKNSLIGKDIALNRYNYLRPAIIPIGEENNSPTIYTILSAKQYQDLPSEITYPIRIDKSALHDELSKFMSPIIVKIVNDLETNLDTLHYKNMYPYVAILGMIDCFGPSYFSYPKKWYTQYDIEYTIDYDKHTQVYFEQYLGPVESPSDLTTLGNLFLAIITNKNNLEQYCYDNSLNYNKIREMLNYFDETQKILKFKTISTFDAVKIVNELRPYLSKYFSKYQLQRDYVLASTENRTVMDQSVRYWPINEYPIGTGKEYRLDEHQCINRFVSNPPPIILGIITREVESANLISIGLDLPTL